MIKEVLTLVGKQENRDVVWMQSLSGLGKGSRWLSAGYRLAAVKKQIQRADIDQATW